MRRAAWSAVANIAEGSARLGSREFRRFLDISLGSLAEVAYGLYFARDRKLLTASEYIELEALLARATKLTGGLCRSMSKGRQEA